MEPSDQKRDYIVFMDAPKGPMSVLSIPTDETDSAIEARAIPRDPNPKKEILGPDRKIGDVAWLRVTFNEADTAQQAANIARSKNLVYIPQNFIVGLRNRRPDLGMGDIRVEFARRSAEATAQKDPVSHATARQIDAIRDVLDALSDVDWADIDRSDAYTIPRRNPR